MTLRQWRLKNLDEQIREYYAAQQKLQPPRQQVQAPTKQAKSSEPRQRRVF